MNGKEILYKSDLIPTPDEVIELFENAGMPRPTNDRERISKMLANASLIITAWDDRLLVGLSRSLTDFCWCCYLSDLAVRSDYQKHGIGGKLIRLTKESAGAESMLLLLSVPDAMGYYPKIGFEKQENAFLIHRTK